MKLNILKDKQGIAAAIAELTMALSMEAISERGSFNIALSGGSLLKLLSPTLTAPPLKENVEWDKWTVFFADERCVPLDHVDSNYHLAKKELFSRAGIPGERIYPANPALPPQEAAAEYHRRLEAVFQPAKGCIPRFDLILLGMGEDGHTASLFPGHKLIEEKKLWVAAELHSPKPPPARITFTLPLINNARHVAFAAAGTGKTTILPKVLPQEDAPSSLPAGLVRPAAGELTWFVDKAAAGLPEP